MTWLPGWNYRKRITISASQVDSTLINFPLCVPLAQTDIDGSQTSGFDIRFADANGSLLDYTWTGFTDGGRSGAFVKIPTISSSFDTTFYMYYGNATATNASSPSSVWSDYTFVAHLDEAIGSLVDSVNGYSISANGSPISASGAIGNGVHVTPGNCLELSSSDVADLTSDLDSVSACAFSLIVKDWSPSTVTEVYTLMLNSMSGSGGAWIDVRPPDHSTIPNYVVFKVNSNGILKYISGDTGWSDGSTGHLAGTVEIDSGNFSTNIYADGSQVASGSVSTSDTTLTLTDSSRNIFRLGWPDSGGTDAIIDEIRIRRVATSAAWLKFENANLMNSGNEITLAERESLPTIAGPYQAIVKDVFQTEVQQAETYTPGIMEGHTYGS